MTDPTTLPAPAPAIPRLDAEATVNAILDQHPAALRVLNAFGIDACCGGARTLVEAAREDGADLSALVAALEWALVDDDA